MAQEKQIILIPDYLTVRELAELIEASPIEVMKHLIANGIMASINQQVDYDTAAIVAEEMGFEAQSASAMAAQAERQKAAQSQTWRQVYTQEKPENLQRRPPIVTILGHVDHGKTTLLDTIRKAHVAEDEAGGITQHIGAYRVMRDGRQITFLDTPGHEAFTAMRARGAQGADIAVLVVAADDSVMPTTREALNHARAANVPIVVAITKIDKRNANPEVVKKDLSEVGLTPDEWGGSTLVVPVSAVTGEGIEDLLEAILLTADDSEIVANPNADASGVVLEAEVDPSRGTLATLLVLNGTLRRGDVVIAGHAYGRIKAMFDEMGQTVLEAGPSTPVRVLGLSEPPLPGEGFEKIKNEKVARSMIDERRATAEAQRVEASRPAFTLEDMFAQFTSGEVKELNLIVKVDVQGSLQPIVDSLKTLGESNKHGISIRILSSEIGNISENDVMLAKASGAIIVGFNVDVDNAARRIADAQGVDIRQYTIIYKLLEDIELALQGLLEPVYQEKVIGVAEVRQTFKIPRVGTIAGCYIREGEVRRNARTRVKRGGKPIAENVTVASLKRLTEDVREVRAGFECGIGLNGFNDFHTGDLIEFYVMERAN
ncbi:MAG: translation initiation factor IF-2 [Chloroflexi bacterium]|nr:translation initiation factor IF-2 [Chloroflexota bacterium]MDL1882133.1 translation initiation factor IF-2 [Anaerolineae bacterium CFX8]